MNKDPMSTDQEDQGLTLLVRVVGGSTDLGHFCPILIPYHLDSYDIFERTLCRLRQVNVNNVDEIVKLPDIRIETDSDVSELQVMQGLW